MSRLRYHLGRVSTWWSNSKTWRWRASLEGIVVCGVWKWENERKWLIDGMEIPCVRACFWAFGFGQSMRWFGIWIVLNKYTIFSIKISAWSLKGSELTTLQNYLCTSVFPAEMGEPQAQRLFVEVRQWFLGPQSQPLIDCNKWIVYGIDRDEEGT